MLKRIKKRRSQRRQPRWPNGPTFESLEGRVLMSANPVVGPPTEPFVQSADLIVDRSAQNGTDKLALQLSGGNIELTDKKGNVLASHPADDLRSLTIIGRDDAKDDLTVDFASGGSFDIPGGVLFDAGGGKKDDSVTVIGAVAGGAYQVDGSDLFNETFRLSIPEVERLRLSLGTGDDVVGISGSPGFDRFDIKDAGGDDAYHICSDDGTMKIDDKDGDDTYGLTPTGGTVEIKDKKKGLDIIDLSAAPSGVSLNLSGGDGSLGLGSESVKLKGQMEVILGSPFNDDIVGSKKGDLILGGGGNDNLDGGAGNDVVIGQAGVDNLLGNSGEDILLGGDADLENGLEDLIDVLEKWTEKGKFEDRVWSVRFFEDPMDTAFLLNEHNIHDDGEADNLDGGSSDDFAPLGQGDGILNNIELDIATRLPDFSAATFSDSTNIDHPLYPLIPGAHREYEGEFFDEEEGELVMEGFVLDVLEETIMIQGIEARIVLDSAFEEDLLVEQTFDYFAQDDLGNVWYLGEDVTNFIYDDDDNLIETNDESAWLTGVNGALPGIVMPANPVLGDNYYQEFSPVDEALDIATNTVLGANVDGPLGPFSDVLIVIESSPVEPDVMGNKQYAPDFNLVREEEHLDEEGVPELVVELVAFTQGIPLKEAKLNIEHNATDLDTGFQGFIDGEGWQQLTVTGPDDDPILSFEAHGALESLGLNELFFETVEPENAEVSIAEMLAKLPAGDYAINGPFVEDGEIAGQTTGVATLTHLIPEGPELQSPAEEAIVSPDEPLLFEWDAVTQSIDAQPVDIIAYQLIVEKITEANPNMLGKFGFSAYVPSDTTSVTLPAEFLEPDTAYEWEVLAIEASGNQTLSSSEFATGDIEVVEPPDVDDPPDLKAARLIIEHNATDLDTGFQGFVDSEGWANLEVTGPGGELVLSFEGLGDLAELGLTELFFETVEPENAEVSIAEMLAKLPAGDYEISGISMQNGEGGETTAGTALLTHVIPAGPELLGPGEGEEVEIDELIMSWNAVTETIGGAAVNIIAYQLIVQPDIEPDDNMIGGLGLSVYLPPTVTSFAVPTEVLQAGTDYEWEVLAIEQSGNQTLSASEFSTA